MDKKLKHDTAFIETELPYCFADNMDGDVSFDSTFDLFVLWIALKIQNNSFVERHKSVQSDLQSYITKHSTNDTKLTINEDTISFYNTYFPEESRQDTLKIENVHVALNYITDHTFTRSSKSQETILVISEE